jgi:hypothetical protein
LLRQDAAYSSELMSIAGPEHDVNYLALVAATISSSFGNYWQFMTSASWGIERGTVEENELLAMPIPPLMSGNDANEVMTLLGRASAGQSSLSVDEVRTLADDLIFDLFELGATDRFRIREGVASGIARFDGGPAYQANIDESVLEGYRRTLRISLARSLADVEVRVGFVREGGYVSAWVSFEDSRDSGRARKGSARVEHVVDTDEVLRSGGTVSAATIGMVSLPAAFLVDEDTVYLVKTADRDRWSYDAALNDADRIFAALAFGS